MARDYFRVGETEPLINGFADWVGNGYRALGVDAKPAASALRSFRFFARGAGKDAVACGIVRDSGDAVGRPYPLLLMGCGLLKGWEERWDLLPLACEKTWEQMEYASANASGDVAGLDARVRGTRPPEGDWSALAAHREGRRDPAPPGPSAAGETARDAALLVRLDEGMSTDVDVAASVGLLRAMAAGRPAPNAVFIGGTFERTDMALYFRSLTPSDFAALWGIGPTGRERT